MNIRTKGGPVEYRASASYGMWTPEMEIATMGRDRLRAGSATVGNVGSIPLFDRAVQIASHTIAGLELCEWRGRDALRERVTTTWRARLFSGPPNEAQSQWEFQRIIEASLTARSNAYIVKIRSKSTGRVLEWYAMHPDQVSPSFDNDGDLFYHVLVKRGYVDPFEQGEGRYDIDDDDIIHLRRGGYGELVAASPVERFRDVLSSEIGRQKAARNVYDRGLSMKVGVSFPSTLSQAQTQQYMDMTKQRFEGVDAESQVFVTGGGATIAPITMTMRDAQFVESAALGAYDIARITNVPASLLEAPMTAASHNQSPLEQELARWYQFGLKPRSEQIASAIASDPDFYQSSSPTYPAFDLSGFVRGDVMTEATVLVQQVQSGILAPDEARALLGLPPHPGGIGATPQYTPVGGAPNPDAPETDEAPPTPPDL